ncbi:cobyrinate a,c-diamide synthase [Lampropedia puyangensis]|uniref:Cobyrinate a,c-diamide synthase n=1 Tax=Lampropedia puyangensis TaxID=1330072 RepID=A0A4S8FES3_9BURK|nr:cobyrinate a,c-diamide synthase [Lampropedia puyangensis]THU05531.1 cobyrinate a,c-diamide synthase [Lampropedia puyangensis]
MTELASPPPLSPPAGVKAEAQCVALLVTATASGQGKTLVTAALARWHVRQGRRVRIFKCGPDFLDPQWHELASGAPVHNVDLWMTGEADIHARFQQAAQEADVVIVEGVMGLFDGTPSAADLAQRWNIAVMPVLQVGSMAQTCAALVHGLKHYRPDLRWAGVLCNGVASEHHANLLEQSLEEAGDWLGAMPKLQAPVSFSAQAHDKTTGARAFMPERHLGLVSASEMPDSMQRLDSAADALAQTVLGHMPWHEWQARWSVDWSATVPSIGASPAGPQLCAAEADVPPLLQGKTIAVARDAAFAFVYAANVQLLHALGAQVVFFAPLAGDDLPACDAVWLPGGYPELHAPALRANTRVQQSLRQHWLCGKPMWAECGGMVALCEAVRLRDGTEHPLWGLLPGLASMQPRLAGLGPQQLAWPGGTEDKGRGIVPSPLRGHTFHYSTLQTPVAPWGRTVRPVLPGARAPGKPGAAQAGEAVYRHGSLVASYFHAWFASSPRWVARLFLGDLE